MTSDFTNISFWLDADCEAGMGHLYRCLALAVELRNCGATCHFHGNPYVNRVALRNDFPVTERHLVNTGEPIAPAEADVWIVDLEKGMPMSLAKALRDKCDVLVSLNGVGYGDGNDGHELADLVWWQGCSADPYEMDWSGFQGEWYEGVEWVILREMFRKGQGHREHHMPWARSDPLHVFIHGGGADKGNVMPKVVEALQGQGYKLRVMIGAASPYFHAYTPPGVTVLNDPTNVAGGMAWADLAIISYGMTAFELLALGVPVVAFSITEGHLDGAKLAEIRSKGALLSGGLIDDVDEEMIRIAVDCMLSRQDPSLAAVRWIDGEGVVRVADRIMEAVCV